MVNLSQKSCQRLKTIRISFKQFHGKEAIYYLSWIVLANGKPVSRELQKTEDHQRISVILYKLFHCKETIYNLIYSWQT